MRRASPARAGGRRPAGDGIPSPAGRFQEARFRPDGNALAVTFSLGSVVVRETGPIPGDEAARHFGLIWPDGRKRRTAPFEIDRPRGENEPFAAPQWLAWTRRPALEE